MEDGSFFRSDSLGSPSQTALVEVQKVLTNLAEVAADANLEVTKFTAIAKTLPSDARTAHDRLYRATDVYLKVSVSYYLKYAYYSCNIS